MRENLKATKSFTYAGRALKAGDTFSAASRDARVLRAVRRAETYETAQAVAEVTKDVPAGADDSINPDAPAAAAVAADAPGRKPRAKKEPAK